MPSGDRRPSLRGTTSATPCAPSELATSARVAGNDARHHHSTRTRVSTGSVTNVARRPSRGPSPMPALLQTHPTLQSVHDGADRSRRGTGDASTSSATLPVIPAHLQRRSSAAESRGRSRRSDGVAPPASPPTPRARLSLSHGIPRTVSFVVAEDADHDATSCTETTATPILLRHVSSPEGVGRGSETAPASIVVAGTTSQRRSTSSTTNTTTPAVALSFRDRVNKNAAARTRPPPRRRLPRRRPASNTGRGTSERRRRGLGHTSTALGRTASGHAEADRLRSRGLGVLLFVTWFHTRLMGVVRRARAGRLWRDVLAPRAAFVIQCFWRRVRQRRRVRRLCAVALLVPWLRLKLCRLRRAKAASAALLQRVFRGVRTRVWVRTLYDAMYVHRALRLLQRHVRRWEDQKLLRYLRSQREERHLLFERAHQASSGLLREERAAWLALLRRAHDELGFIASDPDAVVPGGNVERAAVWLRSPLHTLEGCQVYVRALFSLESGAYLTPAATCDGVAMTPLCPTPPSGPRLDTTGQHDELAVSEEPAADAVLNAFVELLARVETMERKELERDLLRAHTEFCAPVQRISHAIRLCPDVPRLYAALLIGLPTVAAMQAAARLFRAEQRERTAIVTEYVAVPLLSLTRPGFSAAAEQRRRTLLTLMAQTDEAAPATCHTHNVADGTCEDAATLALYEDDALHDSACLTRQLAVAVDAHETPVAEEDAAPRRRRLRVVMQPTRTPCAVAPLPLLHHRPPPSRHTAGPAHHSSHDVRAATPTRDVAAEPQMLSSGIVEVRDGESETHSASSRAARSQSDRGSDGFAASTVSWSACTVSEQTASKSSAGLLSGHPVPPSPPPRQRHRSQYQPVAADTQS